MNLNKYASEIPSNMLELMSRTISCISRYTRI